MAHQRTQDRHRKRIQVRYGVDAASRIGFTEDISIDGFFLRTAAVQKPGTMMLFELSLPDGTLVSLTGSIRWAKRVPPNLLNRVKGGFGVRIDRFHSGVEAYRELCEALGNRY